MALSSDNVTVHYTACGAILNTSMENEPLQCALLSFGVLEKLKALLLRAHQSDFVSKESTIYGMALRAISNMVETEDGIQKFVADGTLSTVFDLIKMWQSRWLADPQQSEASIYLIDGISIILESVSEDGNIFFHGSNGTKGRNRWRIPRRPFPIYRLRPYGSCGACKRFIKRSA